MLSIQIQNGYINGCDNKPCRYTHISYSTWYIPNASPLSQPPKLPDCGLEARNTSQKCRQLYIFLQAGSVFCVEICHKQKIHWVTKWSVKLICLQQPIAWFLKTPPECLPTLQRSWIDYTPPFWAGFESSVSAFFVMKTSRKTQTNSGSCSEQPLKGQNFESQQKNTNWPFRWTLDASEEMNHNESQPLTKNKKFTTN